MDEATSTAGNTVQAIFDPERRQAKINRALDRARNDGGIDNFLWEHLANDIAERLSMVTRQFDDILLIGPAADYTTLLLGNRDGKVSKAYFTHHNAAEGGNASVIENEILPYQAGDFDLVICFGVLDGINDLPGFMFQLRHILQPDGLFLGSAFGAGSLATLKKALIMAEGDGAQAHIHPQIDLHNMSQLVSQAGFALPVVDQDRLQVRYSSLHALLSDLRNMALGNVLTGPQPYLGRDIYSRLHDLWQGQAAEDGKTVEHFNFLHINGWAPSPDQPKPARRGSGQASLADILGKEQKPD